MTEPLQLTDIGITPRKAAQFASKGIETVQDLLMFFPTKYLDFRNPINLAEGKNYAGKHVAVKGQVVGTRVINGKHFMLRLSDGKNYCSVFWFNQAYRQRQFYGGQVLAIGGIATWSDEYKSLTLAVRNAIKHGYVEVFRKDESNHLRISPDGIKYIRTTAKDSLDSEKRATMKRRFKGEQGRRLNRVETTSCMCRAAGIKLAKEEGIQLTNILNTNTKDYEKFMENYFYNKGLLFLSDELSATIKATNTVGEEYTTGMSRLVGAIINSKGIYYLYCTLDKLMKWIISYEKRRVSAITALLQNSNAATENQDFQTACSIQPKSIIIGKTCAMIPKIITGDKYGKNIKRAGEATITNKLMTLANLEEVYKHNYFVPTDTLGVELLSRTVTLTRDDLNQMIEMWLSEMTDKHTILWHRATRGRAGKSRPRCKH